MNSAGGRAPQSDDISLILHLSDPHFGTEQDHAVETLLTLAEEQRPDVVVVSGDLTQRARSAEFERAARFLGRLAPRHCLVVPGNHDIALWNLPRRVFLPYASFRAAFGPDIEPRLAAPRAWITGVRTTRRWRHRRGTLSDRQIEETAQWLEGAPDGALRIVVAHHPFAALRWHQQDDVLSAAQRALARWLAARVHLVLGGHAHEPYHVSVADPRLQPGHVLWVAQAGSAVSRRVRQAQAHSVNLLRRAPDGGWRLERWDLARGDNRFRQMFWQWVGEPVSGPWST